MTNGNGERRPPRTVLEQKIRERQQTFEEFVEYAEKFARDHNESATLSVRHLERLAAGHRGDGRPLGPPRPATARLLQRIFGLPIAELLAVPEPQLADDSDAELRLRLNASRRVDTGLLDLLADQLNAIRRIDRQLGAAVSYSEITTKTAQITRLMTYSLSPAIRARLAALLSEASALAGWAALDQGQINQSWQHHEHAKTAAREAVSQPLMAHATAQQAVILIDLGESIDAVKQLAEARSLAGRTAPALLQAWLAAGHGEGLAAADRREEALRAFDLADALLPANPVDPILPFVFLGGVHLTRWRGHALATLGDREATAVLTEALLGLDPTFVRAEVGVRADLASALAGRDDHDEALLHIRHAQHMASEIGSPRLEARLRTLDPHFSDGGKERRLGYVTRIRGLSGP